MWLVLLLIPTITRKAFSTWTLLLWRIRDKFWEEKSNFKDSIFCSLKIFFKLKISLAKRDTLQISSIKLLDCMQNVLNTMTPFKILLSTISLKRYKSPYHPKSPWSLSMLKMLVAIIAVISVRLIIAIILQRKRILIKVKIKILMDRKKRTQNECKIVRITIITRLIVIAVVSWVLKGLVKLMFYLRKINSSQMKISSLSKKMGIRKMNKEILNVQMIMIISCLW